MLDQSMVGGHSTVVPAFEILLTPHAHEQKNELLQLYQVGESALLLWALHHPEPTNYSLVNHLPEETRDAYVVPAKIRRPFYVAGGKVPTLTPAV